MIIKVKFDKKSKDLYWMKKSLRKERKELSTNQKIKICLDKQKGL